MKQELKNYKNKQATVFELSENEGPVLATIELYGDNNGFLNTTEASPNGEGQFSVACEDGTLTGFSCDFGRDMDRRDTELETPESDRWVWCLIKYAETVLSGKKEQTK